jgi:diaminopimelate decarboxylase
MNDLIRPMLYDSLSLHLARVARRGQRAQRGATKTFRPPAAKSVDVVGPICESGDFLARDRPCRRPSAAICWPSSPPAPMDLP